MSKAPQTLATHARYYPTWHYVVFPILTFNVVVEVVRLFRGGVDLRSLWAVAVSVALFLTAWTARIMAVTAQNRVIRLEERLRLTHLLPADLHAAAANLHLPLLIALRFAPDGEVAGLVRRIDAGELTTVAAVKKAIAQWRPDHLRV